MPMAATSLAMAPALRIASRHVATVLDLAIGRKMLREFLLRRSGDRHVGAEHDGAGRCCALIDCEHKGRHLPLPAALKKKFGEERAHENTSAADLPRGRAAA